MKWVRGGDWHSVDYRTLAGDLGAGTADWEVWRHGYLKREQWADEGIDYERWLAAVTPRNGGLYELGPNAADAALDALASIFNRFPESTFGLKEVPLDSVLPDGEEATTWVEDASVDRAPYLDAICEFLNRFGPLQRTLGVTPAVSFHLEGMKLHLLNERIANSSTPVARAETANLILEWSRPYLTGGLRVVPLFRAGGLAFDAEPLNLGSYLWLHLFSRCGRNVVRYCRYCGESFETSARSRPGTVPKYCPEHRAGRFRQAVREHRAPSGKCSREPDPDELEQER